MCANFTPHVGSEGDGSPPRRVALFGNSTWCLLNFRENLIRALIRDGHEIIAIAPLDPTYSNTHYIQRLQDLGVQYVPVDLRPRNLNPFVEVRSLLQLCKVLIQARPDYVLSYTVKCNLYAGLIGNFLRYKQIANIPGLGEAFERPGLLQNIVRCLYKVSLRRLNTAVFQNEEDRDFCVRNGLIREEICRTVPGSGVDLTHFQQSVQRPRSGARRFLMFGRLLPQKGYLHFVDCARLLRERWGDRVEFVVMGIPDKNRSASLELAAALEGFAEEGIIRLVEPVTDVRPILNDVDVVVLPTWYNEGVPRSLLEALASGKPIITTDQKGCRSTVIPNQNGLLIPPQDFDALLAALETMIALDDAELRRMGAESRALVERKFSDRFVINTYLEALGRQPLEQAPLETVVLPPATTLSSLFESMPIGENGALAAYPERFVPTVRSGAGE